MSKKKLKLRIILWLGLLFIAGWLVFMKIAPTGNTSYVYEFEKDNFFIGRLTPLDRVEVPRDGKQTIIGDPVYFSLFTPRRFDQAKIRMRFKEKDAVLSRPVIEVGLLADKTVWRYDLKPINNRPINELMGVWDKIVSGDEILLARNDAEVKKYKTIEEFLGNLPPREQIALYNFDLDYEYKIDGYQPRSAKTIVEYPLRGAWQLYTYIKNEEFSFEIKLADINLNLDQDAVDLNLFYDDELIDSRHLADDGPLGASGKASQNEIGLKLTNLPEGVYKLELKTGSDIITEKITSAQNKISFIGKLWLFEGQGVKLYTDSGRIEAVTTNPSSLQTVTVNGRPFDIGQTYKQFDYTANAPESEIALATGDITISGNGLFAFDKFSLFDPDLEKVDASYDPGNRPINYILARYSRPLEENGWHSAEAVFDMRSGYRENGKYNFLISIPGLRADDSLNDGIILDKIEVELSGKNIIDYIRKFFKD